MEICTNIYRHKATDRLESSVFKSFDDAIEDLADNASSYEYITTLTVHGQVKITNDMLSDHNEQCQNNAVYRRQLHNVVSRGERV